MVERNYVLLSFARTFNVVLMKGSRSSSNEKERKNTKLTPEVQYLNDFIVRRKSRQEFVFSYFLTLT